MTSDLFDVDLSPFALERSLLRDGETAIAGVDEAGRGALAGPVVAAAVIFVTPSKELLRRVRDSKRLSPESRDELDPMIRSGALSFGIGVVEPDEIDRLNILRASLKAMEIAIRALRPTPTLSLIDGNQRIPFEGRQRLIVKGDDRVFSIGAASILAKVERDRRMIELAGLFPAYRFDENKGYGTAPHLAAIERDGPCAIHRLSFALPGTAHARQPEAW